VTMIVLRDRKRVELKTKIADRSKFRN